MALALYSGKDAYVDSLQCVVSWQATKAATAQRYSASCVAGATNVAPPVLNWTGQMQGYGAQPNAILSPLLAGNAQLTFQGVINNDAGEGDLKSLEGIVVIESITIDINKENAAPISWQCSFGFQGNPTVAAAGAADAAESVDMEYGDALDIKIGSSPATIVATSVAVRTAQIVFRRPSTAFVKGGTTYRKPGNIEADVNFSLYTPDLTVASYNAGVLAKTRFMTGTTSYWELNAIRYLGLSNFQVDRGGTNILGYSVNGQWNALSAAGLGWITYYDGTDATDYYGTSA